MTASGNAESNAKAAYATQIGRTSRSRDDIIRKGPLV